MLKCEIKKTGRGTVLKLSATGTAKEITVDTAALIGAVYQNINKKSPEAAEDFKHVLIGVLLDPDSPVWTEEWI